MCDLLSPQETQELAALGRLTLLQALPHVVAALPPALGGLLELRVHEKGWDDVLWDSEACPHTAQRCRLHAAPCLSCACTTPTCRRKEASSSVQLTVAGGEPKRPWGR